jgi:hypothetical protein
MCMALMCMAQDPSALRVKAETKQREADRLKVSAPSGRFAALCSLYRGARSLSLSLSLYLSLSLSLCCVSITLAPALALSFVVNTRLINATI